MGTPLLPIYLKLLSTVVLRDYHEHDRVINSTRESGLKVHHELFLLVLDMKRGEAAKEGLKAVGATEEQTKRVWNSIIGLFIES